MPESAREGGGTVAERLASVRLRVDEAASRSGRRPEDVLLVAVSKMFAAEHVREALAAGQRHFGENRVQEAMAKWPALKAEYPDAVLHLIGPLQTNKVRDAVELFDVIETVDRRRLADALARECARQDRWPRLMAEVNTGEEPQKAGVIPDEIVDFVAAIRSELKLEISGLMCIPPIDEEPAMHFALLAKLAERAGVEDLSMGMSHDFETAIAFGATEVRVGTAIFGARPTSWR